MPLRKAAIVFLVLCLQFQAAAALVMPCAHQHLNDAPSIGCHQGIPDKAMADGNTGESCAKCTLDGVTGGFQGPTAVFMTAFVIDGRAVTVPAVPRHFYHFVPDQPDRPPRV